ncbi:MAG TPA: FISUMP domain-containing protein [bacterium]|nr:FISUMP domain-containing protein [bacterium]
MLKTVKPNKPAFTLIELLVVIAIIGIISTLAVVSLTNARQSARDAKRIADIKQIQTALELYYQDNGEYPSSITDSIATSGNIYMQSFPIAPTPADGDCSDSNNTYTYTVSGTENSSYSLTFCLGSQTNDLSAGIKEAIPGGITSASVYEACSASTVCGQTCSYEGINYSTVQIDNQCWFAKNLNIGTKISYSCLTGQLMEMEWSYGGETGSYYKCCTPEDKATDTLEGDFYEYCNVEYELVSQSDNSIIEKHCYDDNDSNCNIYGGLYEWDEAMQYSTSQKAQGICPSGWHIPSYSEWTALTNYLSTSSQYWCGGDYSQTGKSLANTSGWTSTTTVCYVGNDQSSNNTTGFSALPAGSRNPDGSFYEIGDAVYFWSSTIDDTNIFSSFLYYGYANVNIGGVSNNNPGISLSVRCLQD